ncbi:MAG: hypothetical protein ABIF12_00155 [bacterium]
MNKKNMGKENKTQLLNKTNDNISIKNKKIAISESIKPNFL